LEILNLLKILLIDSKEESLSDSTQNYANSFLKIDGIEILLYLSTNSTLDIKSMSLKLIDGLSKFK